MAKIKTGNVTTGRPGYKRGGSMSRFTGSFVSKTQAAKGSVRRLIAHNPAKGTNANIGTKNDIGRFTNNSKIPNLNADPHPRVLKAPNFKKGNAFDAGQKHVVNRSVNRNTKRTKF